MNALIFSVVLTAVLAGGLLSRSTEVPAVIWAEFAASFAGAFVAVAGALGVFEYQAASEKKRAIEALEKIANEILALCDSVQTELTNIPDGDRASDKARDELAFAVFAFLEGLAFARENRKIPEVARVSYLWGANERTVLRMSEKVNVIAPQNGHEARQRALGRWQLTL